jgi:hypothetical protein
VNEASAHKSLTDLRGLFPAVFQHQPAACLEMRRRIAHNNIQRLQARRPGNQRHARFMPPDLGREVGIVLPDVGRIGRDHVKALPRQRREPAAV